MLPIPSNNRTPLSRGQRSGNAIGRSFLAVLLFCTIAEPVPALPGQIDVTGSPGFGEKVQVLRNHHVVVVDTSFQSNTGAVYLLRPDGSTISTLKGRAPGDRVGSGGILLLDNGHFVVLSPDWQSPQGAVGAATWVDGQLGRNGLVDASNSLTGQTQGDHVGERGIALRNGRYLVAAPRWRNGTVVSAGAVTVLSGTAATAMLVSAANSLVGASAGDMVGSGDMAALPNGDAVVASPLWGGQRGAVTQIRQAVPLAGAISASNSLVGASAGDSFGLAPAGRGITVLRNGNYVVCSPEWSEAAAGTVAVGAATWMNAANPLTGVVSAVNSLVGPNSNFHVCGGGVTALSDGHYVVASPRWRVGSAGDVGAVTWANGDTGLVGSVTAANSLTGQAALDRVGEAVTALVGGGYVVVSPDWSTAMLPAVGAVTWRQGGAPAPGVVSEGNSLVGASTNDRIGSGGVVALAAGAYAVASPAFSNGPHVQAGAVTRLPGGTFFAGSVSGGNSALGDVATARVGTAITALANGHFAVASPFWRYTTAGSPAYGAVTWFDGTFPTSGGINPGNSVIGAAADDELGSGGFTALPDGTFLVYSPSYDAGPLPDASALCRYGGTSAISGGPSPAYCVIAQTSHASEPSWNWSYDPTASFLAVGRPKEGIVTLLPPPDVIFASGFQS